MSAATSSSVRRCVHIRDSIDRARPAASTSGCSPHRLAQAPVPASSAENPPEETANGCFRPGVKDRCGNLDSGCHCNRAIAEEVGNQMRCGGGVECEGDGINVALSKDE
jgi:hypothetical protein